MTTPEPDTAPPAYTTHRRRKGTLPDLVRSLAVVGVGVVALVLFAFQDQPTHAPVTTDVAATVQAARSAGSPPDPAATVLPPGWYANAARFEASATGSGSDFHIGYSDGASAYVGIDSTDAVDARALTSDYAMLEPSGTRTIAGSTFTEYADGSARAWLHRATRTEPWTMRITATDGAAAEAVVAAISGSGTVAVEGA